MCGHTRSSLERGGGRQRNERLARWRGPKPVSCQAQANSRPYGKSLLLSIGRFREPGTRKKDNRRARRRTLADRFPFSPSSFMLIPETAMPSKFTILGDGAWGTTIAILLAADPAHRVSLWSARAENARLMRLHRANVRLLPGVPIPPNIELTTDITGAVAGADLWIAAIPTVYMRGTLDPIAAILRGQDVPALSLAKGLENETFQRPSEILRQ